MFSHQLLVSIGGGSSQGTQPCILAAGCIPVTKEHPQAEYKVESPCHLSLVPRQYGTLACLLLFCNPEGTKYMDSSPGIWPGWDSGILDSSFSPCSNSLCIPGWHLPPLELSFFNCKMGMWIIAVFPNCGIWITGGTEVSFGNK